MSCLIYTRKNPLHVNVTSQENGFSIWSLNKVTSMHSFRCYTHIFISKSTEFSQILSFTYVSVYVMYLPASKWLLTWKTTMARLSDWLCKCLMQSGYKTVVKLHFMCHHVQTLKVHKTMLVCHKDSTGYLKESLFSKFQASASSLCWPSQPTHEHIEVSKLKFETLDTLCTKPSAVNSLRRAFQIIIHN